MTAVHHLLARMLERGASDLYVTVGAPPMLRVDDRLEPGGDDRADEPAVQAMLADLLDEAGLPRFRAENELNTALDLGPRGRFRINAFRQRQRSGLVIRQIPVEIPSLDRLGLPTTLGDLCLQKRGLVIMVGATGSGKSTTLAAMLHHRNRNRDGHIITIEDPIEFIHEHDRCLITQREVGIDTDSFDTAIKNALRQKPDIILIGEVRDAATMEHAVRIAETGHLCLCTLHANNANQAIERILGFFPREAHDALLMSLSLNLQAVVSQRLVRTLAGGRAAALELMLNRGLIRERIRRGEFGDLKALIAGNRDDGMQTFDQHLLDLWKAGRIDQEVALAEADSRADLRLAMQTRRI